VVEIQTLSEREERLFLPLEARAITPEPGGVKVDPFGVIKRGGKGPPLVVRFRPGPRDRAAPAPPRGEDRHLSRRVRSRLEEQARQWTEGARSDEEKLDAIQRRLGGTEFRYARAFRRDTDIDPVLDFLLRDRTGHCEYFASGMVLMARVAGIPARVTTGYRVAEHNALGGYHVVRERNAHAWVEAWIEGKGWVSYDPTPEGPLSQNKPHETGVGAAVMDLVRVRYDEAVQWLGQRTAGQIAVASAVGLAALGWLVARGVARQEKPRAAAPDEEPLPWMRDLLDALAREGVTHEPHEALSALAGRAGDPEAASLLRRYEALRYGGEGDGVSLAREAAAWVARRRRPPGAALRGGVLVREGRGLRVRGRRLRRGREHRGRRFLPGRLRGGVPQPEALDAGMLGGELAQLGAGEGDAEVGGQGGGEGLLLGGPAAREAGVLDAEDAGEVIPLEHRDREEGAQLRVDDAADDQLHGAWVLDGVVGGEGHAGGEGGEEVGELLRGEVLGDLVGARQALGGGDPLEPAGGRLEHPEAGALDVEPLDGGGGDGGGEGGEVSLGDLPAPEQLHQHAGLALQGTLPGVRRRGGRGRRLLFPEGAPQGRVPRVLGGRRVRLGGALAGGASGLGAEAGQDRAQLRPLKPEDRSALHEHPRR
jgi:transglutaminase-like putative cysteine protease